MPNTPSGIPPENDTRPDSNPPTNRPQSTPPEYRYLTYEEILDLLEKQ